MNFQELRQAVSAAIRQRDHAQFRALVDDFLATASGEDYALALCLQADGYLLLDPKNIAEGFVLLDEALPRLIRSPGARVQALTTALGLCFVSSDVERARLYEEDACRILLEYGTDPGVRSKGYRLQFNLGLVAYLRSDYATSYWYFAQAANSVTGAFVPAEVRQSSESMIQLHTAMACLRVRRYFEAQEALDLAEQTAPGEQARIRVSIWRCELFRQLGLIDEASSLVASLEGPIKSCADPDARGRYYWVAALVAQDSGDLPRFHRLLALAHAEAADHCYDYLLSEIQRLTRTPM